MICERHSIRPKVILLFPFGICIYCCLWLCSTLPMLTAVLFQVSQRTVWTDALMCVDKEHLYVVHTQRVWTALLFSTLTQQPDIKAYRIWSAYSYTDRETHGPIFLFLFLLNTLLNGKVKLHMSTLCCDHWIVCRDDTKVVFPALLNVFYFFWSKRVWQLLLFLV